MGEVDIVKSDLLARKFFMLSSESIFELNSVRSMSSLELYSAFRIVFINSELDSVSKITVGLSRTTIVFFLSEQFSINSSKSE